MTHAVETVHNRRYKAVSYQCTKPTSLRTYQTDGSCSFLEECSAAQVNLLQMQYSQLYIFIGKNAPELRMLKRDVALEIQVEVPEDTVVRLQMTVGGFLRQTSEVNVGQTSTASPWFRHLGSVRATSSPAWDRVRWSEVSSHLNRCPTRYSSEELIRVTERQLMSVNRGEEKRSSSVNLCVSDGACPTSAFKSFCRYMCYTRCGCLRGTRRGGLDRERGGVLEEDCCVRYRATHTDEPEVIID